MSIAPKLTDKQVAVIRLTLNETNAQELADRFGVSKVTIQSAATGRGAYNLHSQEADKLQIPPPIEWIRQKRSDGLSEAKKVQIKRLVKGKDKLNLTFEKIGDMFGISETYVFRIAQGDYDA